MFLFNLEYALAIPTSYVDIDRDEMEYVDGGAAMNIAKVNGIPVIATFYLSNSDLWAVSVAGASLAGILGILSPEPFISKAIAVASILVATVAGIGAAYGKKLKVQYILGVGTKYNFY